MSQDLQLLEQRIAQLELDVSQLKVQSVDCSKEPWWVQIAGRFENDPVFDEIVRLGKEYRESLRPENG